MQQLDGDGNYVVTKTAAGEDVLIFELFPELEIDLSKVWLSDE